jgi:hypothetical protein
MGYVIDFQNRAVAVLQARVAEVEESNRDLIAFARGHSGGVASIHKAVIAAIEAGDLVHLIHTVTHDWPDLLGVDAIALALHAGERGVRADADGIRFVDRRVCQRIARGVDGVVLRGVIRGHPLFGPAADLIRAEALVRLDGPASLPRGLLVLGQRSAPPFETRHGSELLVFLGGVLARSTARWLLP